MIQKPEPQGDSPGFEHNQTVNNRANTVQLKKCLVSLASTTTLPPGLMPMLMPPEQGKALFQAEMPEETVTRCVSFGVALFHVVFGCRPDRGRDTCRNSANASIVSQRLHCQRRFFPAIAAFARSGLPPRAQLQNAPARGSRCPLLTRALPCAAGVHSLTTATIST